MPELPEVEVSRLGISPHLLDQTIQKIVIRQRQLRWLIPEEIHQLHGEKILTIRRRAKYLLIDTAKGTAIIHLGMSGSLRVLDTPPEAEKHDHVDLVLSSGKVMRYNDPRRFGAWLWCGPGESHELLDNCGPEPLTDDFSVEWMMTRAKNKRVAVKTFIMTNANVVGVGNIYASESLFIAGVHPLTPTHRLKKSDWIRLVAEIKTVLAQAIAQGGTTLKDFSQTDGKPGYFAQELLVYGRGGQPCKQCGRVIQELKIGQRNTFFCEQCQK
ncbi:bifunctional DNA-formamidopyrimidine glycosylase/DNA-(apurinic or apyrimidinic site) lyase [Vibrio sp. 10N.261.51.F12]|uniref:bifunctional DNA-formamidopyrimidine glycosylase/DNA-(apurinic or apyrimidinic site) lyase n=1 Tax=Vibrio sp. 10N.261.51.F12 TaxID=3229679 RepID=UPI003552C7E6